MREDYILKGRKKHLYPNTQKVYNITPDDVKKIRAHLRKEKIKKIFII